MVITTEYTFILKRFDDCLSQLTYFNISIYIYIYLYISIYIYIYIYIYYIYIICIYVCGMNVLKYLFLV